MIFPKIKSFPIYWENGMKLSADHFQHLENSIEEAVRDARAASLLPLAGFGLLPNSPFDIQNAQGERPNSVKVILNACQAIMPGGFRVEILPENIQKYKLPAQAPYVEFVPSSGVRYHLYLTVSERERIPAGIPETRPIRHPYLVHDYQLECIPQDKLSAVRTLAANRMKIAEWQNGKRLEGYIPPCLTINGFPLLVRWYRYLQNQLENMVRIALQIINEHRKKHLPRAEFCIPIVQHIRGSQAFYKWQLPQQAPTMLAVYFGDLAGLIEGLLETGDRDFVRNQLKNGEINNLRQCIRSLLKPTVLPQEELAVLIARIQKFCEATLLTLQSLISSQGPKPRTGELNISSG